MATLLVLVKVIVALTICGCCVQGTLPDVGLDVFELAKAHGYPLELYEVETPDGYLLDLHRIPHGKNNTSGPNKPVVLMMHGIMSCSADWINIGPEKALAYKLADQGYDVWMGNARGNAESRKHKTLDPDTDKEAFWSFSWNEVGSIDLPALIDFILKTTGETQLQYVGFSQGTTSFLVMASTRPEYNAKLKLVTLLAPAGEMSHVKNPLLRLVAPMEKTLFFLGKALGLYELFPRNGFLEQLSLALCDQGMETQEICNILLFAIAGYNRKQLDGDFIPVIATNMPAGSSLQQFIHYFQITQGSFKHFDFHDEALNIEAYGTAEPPKYDMGLITAPVAIYYGLNDWLVSEVDTQLTASQMPNVVHLQEVVDPAFTHLDFIWSIDVVDLLFNDVLSLINEYN